MGNIKDVLEGYVEVGKFNSRIIKKLDDECEEHFCICSGGCNTCDKCGIVEPVTELIWESDEEWWYSKWNNQNKYVALCEACFS